MAISFKTKANFAFISTLIALAVMGGLSLVAGYNLQSKNAWVTHTYTVLETSAMFRVHLGQAATARRLLVGGDLSQSAVFGHANDAATTDLTRLRQLVADNPEQTARLQQMETLMRARIASQQQSITEYLANHKAQDVQRQSAPQPGSTVNQFNDQLRAFDDTERSLLDERLAEAEVSDRKTVWSNAILSGSAMLFFIFAATILNRELTRREEAERSLAEQKTLLQSVFDSCKDRIVVADQNGRIAYRNRAASRDTKADLPELIDDTVAGRLGYYTEDESTLLTRDELPLWRTVHGEKVDDLEMCVRPPGEEHSRRVVATGRPLKGAKGESTGGVVFYRDVTEQRKSEALLKAAYLEAETTAREKSQLSYLGDLFQSCQTLEEAYQVISSFLPAVLDQMPGMLCLTNPSRNLTEVVARGSGCEAIDGPFNPSDCWGLRMGKTYEGGSGVHALRCAHIAAASNEDYFCVPLSAQGETLGVLYVEQPALTEGNAVEARRERLRRTVTVVSAHISLALANLKLREILRNNSIRDPLTGLFNRRYLEESLTRELNSATRKHRTVALAMLDLDHFKKFNDRLGHQAGDLVLCEAAGIFKTRTRAADLVCRYGGEEFAILLPETDLEGAVICLEEIRSKIKTLTIRHHGTTIGEITISVGLAVFPAHGQTPEELIGAADRALYRAKATGRDRVVLSDEQMDSAVLQTS